MILRITKLDKYCTNLTEFYNNNRKVDDIENKTIIFFSCCHRSHVVCIVFWGREPYFSGRIRTRVWYKSSTSDYWLFNYRNWRSEEHTSELQSRGHLVCRLLLE